MDDDNFLLKIQALIKISEHCAKCRDNSKLAPNKVPQIMLVKEKVDNTIFELLTLPNFDGFLEEVKEAKTNKEIEASLRQFGLDCFE